MSLVENTLFGKINKVDIAIQRIKMYDPTKNIHGNQEKKYILGGLAKKLKK